MLLQNHLDEIRLLSGRLLRG